MEIKPNYKPWMPEGAEEYLSLWKPKSVGQFLDHQAYMLAELLKEADEEEIKRADQMIADRLSPTILISLPNLTDPAFPEVLFQMDHIEMGGLHGAWLEGIAEVINEPSADQSETLEVLASADLESFLSSRV